MKSWGWINWGRTAFWPERLEIINKTLRKKTKYQVTRTPLKKSGVNSGAPDGYSVPAPHVTPILLLCSRILVINEETTGLWLRQTKLIHGHLWHRYSVMSNQVINRLRMSYSVVLIPCIFLHLICPKKTLS